MADRRKEIKSSGADGVQSPGSLGTIGTIMRCNAAAGADEHNGRIRKSKTTQSLTRWQHIGLKPGGQPGSRKRQWRGARVAELSQEPSYASSSHARDAAAHEECSSTQRRRGARGRGWSTGTFLMPAQPAREQRCWRSTRTRPVWKGNGGYRRRQPHAHTSRPPQRSRSVPGRA